MLDLRQGPRRRAAARDQLRPLRLRGRAPRHVLAARRRPGAGGGAAQGPRHLHGRATAGSTSPACRRTGSTSSPRRSPPSGLMPRRPLPHRGGRRGPAGLAAHGRGAGRGPPRPAAADRRPVPDPRRRHAASRAAWIDGLGRREDGHGDARQPARGLPSVQGALLLFDDATGGVLAVIDSALVTRWKTAADSLLGARLLARPDARRLLILGAGAVAAALIEAYRAGFPGHRGRDLEPHARARPRARRRDRRRRPRPTCRRRSPPPTSSPPRPWRREPVLQGAWLRPGPAPRPDRRLPRRHARGGRRGARRARIFVDSFETTLEHIGELRDPLARGVIARADVLGDLHDLVAGRRRAPRRPRRSRSSRTAAARIST